MAVAQPESKILTGTLLVGKYRVEREIGRGGMAAVYEAEHIALGKKVAVKVLAAELSNSAIVIERFFREARAAASVKSPYIVEVYDSGRLEDGRPFIAMEYLDGESLYDRMARVRLIDPMTTVRVLTHCCKGLTKAHAIGIVHRDLKPENIHLTKSEEGEEIAKILDFGLAKFYAPMRPDEKTARLTREGAVFGTPAYMSPEQVKGQGSVDHRADLWALGCMAFECLTGRPVWNTDQGVAMTFAAIAAASPPIPSKLRPDLPPAFDTWFKKALERDPAKRFQSAKELGDALAAAFNTPHISLVNVTRDGRLDLEKLASEVDELPSETVELMPSDRPPPAREAPPPVIVSGPDLVLPQDLTVPMPISSRGGAPRERQLSVADHPPTAAPDVPPSRTRGPSITRYILSGLALGATVVAGYFAYTKLFRPQVSTPIEASTTTSSSARVPAATSSHVKVPAPPATSASPVDDSRPAELVAEAQQLLATNDADQAIAKLKEAQAAGGQVGKEIAPALLEQVAIGKAMTGSCAMKGFAHPRTGYRQNVGRPAVVSVPKGAIVAWTDDHDVHNQQHVYSVLMDPAGHVLDPTGKNSTAPRDLTPEAASVVKPALLATEDRVVLLYWDEKAKDPAAGTAGVRLRWLEGDGSIAGDSIVVDRGAPGHFWPTIARAAETGDFWVAWQDDRNKDGDDLFLRKFDKDLANPGNEIRATDYGAPEKGRAAPRVDVPSLAIARGNLFAAYTLEREKKQSVVRMRVPLNSPALVAGLDEKAPISPQPGPQTEKRKDRELADVQVVSEAGKAGNPQMVCNGDGCFIVWHEQEGGGGAQAALIDPEKGLRIWRKSLTTNGGHPALGVAADGTVMVAFYESTRAGNRLRVATLAKDFRWNPQTFAKVSNPDLKRPWITPGRAKGEWYVAWQDVEAGHSEVYVARLVCQ